MSAENPYAAPEPVAEPNRVFPEPAGPVRLRPLAIFVGWITYVMSYLVVCFLVGIVGAAVLLAQGFRQAQDLETFLSNATWIWVVVLVVPFGCMLLGGYVAAWMEKVAPLRHAFVFGMAVFGTWVVLDILLFDSDPWMSIAAYALTLTLTLPMALFGGYLRSLRAAQVAARAAAA